MSKIGPDIKALGEALKSLPEAGLAKPQAEKSPVEVQSDSAAVAQTRPKISESEAEAISGSLFGQSSESIANASGALDEDRIKALLSDD